MKEMLANNHQFEHWEKDAIEYLDSRYGAQMSASTPPLKAVSTLNISISPFSSH
jgi:hypothetical protein